MFEPSYIRLYESGELENRAEKAIQLLNPCRLCPRECAVDRANGKRGLCKTGRLARVSSHNPHYGEESPLVGRNGSGTIFISSCNLLCSFCQNLEISHGNEGIEVEPSRVASMMLELQGLGCRNINIVTPSHVVPQLIEALIQAILQGLNVPLVYNSSGYDKKETLAILEGIIDIYMPDFKFWDPKWSERYCGAPDYPPVAREAIREMHRQVGDLVMDKQGNAQRGLLVRHLVMPSEIGGTKEIVKFLAEEISPATYLNVMDQYRPCGKAQEDAFIGRRITGDEFIAARDEAVKAGLRRLDPRDRARVFLRLP